MLYVTLYAAVKSDHGFFSSKNKACVKRKIHMKEIAQASCDHVMA
jgi:hypothetical protein